VVVPNRVGERSCFGLLCPHCNGSVIAPHCSKYVSEEQVRHFWSCEDCGHQIESVVDLRLIVSNLSKHITTDRASLAGDMSRHFDATAALPLMRARTSF
jgi:hypothetical protein